MLTSPCCDPKGYCRATAVPRFVAIPSLRRHILLDALAQPDTCVVLSGSKVNRTGPSSGRSQDGPYGKVEGMSSEYMVLHPDVSDPGRAGLCALTVMAKAPRPGKVKTRLAPPLTLQQSAALNICFLRDTTANIVDVTAGGAAAGLICYTPVGDEAAFDGLLPKEFALIAQRGDGFGERLQAAAEDILACGFGAVCLIDSDSPTLPTMALQQAVHELAKPGDRVVLGGSHDGGYYLIGLKQAHAAPFRNITWSTGSVYAETVQQVKEAGLELVELPVWYDVDDGATLEVLEQELLHGVRPGFAAVDGYDAVASRAFLQERKA